MVRKIERVIYLCDVCNEEHTTKEEAELCEAIGKTPPKYKIGDIVTILSGDGKGSKAKIENVFYYPLSWGGSRYAHKVGYSAKLIDHWGSRQLVEGDDV